MGFNLLSVSQLLDEGFEVRFKTGASHVLDSRCDLVCTIIPEGQIFRADFSQCVGSSRCLVAGVSAELWKWHRRLGHLSFDLLSCLCGLGLVRGLPKLKYQKDLVCAPCRHGKMVAASHPPLTSVMTERPCELFHMDLVGPARVCSAGGKWYVLVIVDDYSRYAWVFFLADKGETFGFVRDLILRLKNERNGVAVQVLGILAAHKINPQAHGYHCSFHLRVFQGYRIQGNVCVLPSYSGSKDTKPLLG